MGQGGVGGAGTLWVEYRYRWGRNRRVHLGRWGRVGWSRWAGVGGWPAVGGVVWGGEGAWGGIAVGTGTLRVE